MMGFVGLIIDECHVTVTAGSGANTFPELNPSVRTWGFVLFLHTASLIKMANNKLRRTFIIGCGCTAFIKVPVLMDVSQDCPT